MPPELIPDDEDYASDEDSDFVEDGTAVKGEEDDSSEDEAEAEKAKANPSGKRKRGPDRDEAEDIGIENSGDEAIVNTGRKKQKKRLKKGTDAGVDDEGGEGGEVKTRSMRAATKAEKKVALVDSSTSTIDVDAVYANMLSGSKPTTTSPAQSRSPTQLKRTTLNVPPSPSTAVRPPSTINEDPDAMVMIKRTYTFAGKVHTEQKLVSRDSAEAKLYLSSLTIPKSSDTPTQTTSSPFTKPKRPPKAARRSIFEPITDLPPRTDLNFGIRRLREGVDLLGMEDKGKKLNTVEKSALDWAGYVDQEGIGEEFDKAGKKRGGFRERGEFIARVEGRREEEERRARGIA